MSNEIQLLNLSDFSDYNLSLLHEIPEPPKQLWYQGNLPNQFLKLCATLVTDASDILEVLGIEEKVTTTLRPQLSEIEEKVIKALLKPLDRDTLIRQLNVPVNEAGIILMTMEMQGYIKYEAPHYRSLI